MAQPLIAGVVSSGRAAGGYRGLAISRSSIDAARRLGRVAHEPNLPEAITHLVREAGAVRPNELVRDLPECVCASGPDVDREDPAATVALPCNRRPDLRRALGWWHLVSEAFAPADPPPAFFGTCARHLNRP